MSKMQNVANGAETLAIIIIYRSSIDTYLYTLVVRWLILFLIFIGVALLLLVS